MSMSSSHPMTNITMNLKDLHDKLLRCKVSANELKDFARYMQ